MKVEAISLVRILPAGAASLGEGVTRAQLREAQVGLWSAAPEGEGTRDDLGAGGVGAVAAAAGNPGAAPARPSLDDYDHPLPLGEHAPRKGERVVVLRFGTTG